MPLDANGKMIHDETGKSPVYHDAPIVFMQDRITKARVCYMWVMSFAPATVTGYEIDPHLVHQIGLEFCAGMGEISSPQPHHAVRLFPERAPQIQGYHGYAPSHAGYVRPAFSEVRPPNHRGAGKCPQPQLL